MKDIDFDELDRAVSSVLEPSAEKTPTPASEPAAAAAPVESEPVKVSEAEPASDAEATATSPVAVESAATPVVEPEAPAAPAAKTPLAIKRRGQFMDVVHPSSDMTTKSDDAPLTPTRKLAIKPISTAVVPDDTPESTTPSVEASADVMPDPLDAKVPSEPQAPVETVEPEPAEHVMPDPLDVMETQEEAKDASVAEVSALEDTTVDTSEMPEVAEEEVTEEEASSSTPFLADTKVDKRPLDAFSPDEVVADPLAETVTPTEPLPPELQADVIAVESNPSERADDSAEKDVDDKKDSTETGFNASIPQQYASSESKSDDDHSIFDTHEYHQPLTPAKTKKRGFPGWLTAVLVIFVLAGVGAAAGYFWFYIGL